MKIFAPDTINLHTHSWYCKHGTGQLTEYVDEAIKNNLEVLGFSEHCPIPSDRWSDTRMDFDQLDDYFSECEMLKSQNKDIKILTGLECDYLPEYHFWYKEYLLDAGRVDYLCFGIHTLPHLGGQDTYLKFLPDSKEFLHQYTDQYVKALSSGLFLFGAHPDLFGNFYHKWDDEAKACSKEILACASELGVAIEINGYGLRKPMLHTSEGMRHQYPLEGFWDLAKSYALTVTAHSDAHKPEDLCINKAEYFGFAKKRGIEICSLGIQAETNGERQKCNLCP